MTTHSNIVEVICQATEDHKYFTCTVFYSDGGKKIEDFVQFIRTEAGYVLPTHVNQTEEW